MIFSVLKDQSGRLISCQLSLKLLKKFFHTVFNHVESLNDQAGKLVSAQLWLNFLKKSFHTVVIFDILNDHVDKVVKVQLWLK